MKFLIDTNLLILLVVGMTRPDFIVKHPRLRYFTAVDFLKLENMLAKGEALSLSTFVLTEASNLAVQRIRDPLRTEIRATIKALIDTNPETYVSSASAAARDEYFRVGLTDAALIQQCQPDITLVTADDLLYAAALTAGKNAVSLNELRAER